MTRLLKVKHWQLFILLFGIPFILQFAFAFSMALEPNSMMPYAIMPLVMFLFIAIFFSWFYSLGTALHKRLPESVKMKLTTFKIFLFIPFVYIMVLCGLMFWVFNTVVTGDRAPNLSWFLLIIPIHLFSMFCIFYCLYFVAKSLKAVEWQKPVTFSDYVGEFFLLWFYPVGVWFIQPRVNKLFDKNDEFESSFTT
jgi:hypothetical protein